MLYMEITGYLKIYRNRTGKGSANRQQWLPYLPDTPTEEQLAAKVRASLQTAEFSEEVAYTSLLPGNDAPGQPMLSIFIGGYDENPSPNKWKPQTGDLLYYEDATAVAAEDTGIYKVVKVERPNTSPVATDLNYIEMIAVKTNEEFTGFE
jgi:hypothetical protein